MIEEPDDDDLSENEPVKPDPRDVVDAGSPEGQDKARRNRKRRARREAEFVRSMLADPAGREFFWGLLAVDGGAFQAPFQCGPNGFPQPEATWFRAGQQAFSLGLYHRLLRIDPEGVLLMLRENDGQFKTAAP